jgi:hypothetical protein
VALSAEQRRVAAQALREAQRERATPREQLALLLAGLTESDLQHDRYSRPGSGDRDSVGFLQQRPSQGWGAPGESVATDTRQFLAAARRVNRRGFNGSAGQLAQAVQRSAFPDRYDERRGEAQSILQQLGGAAPEGGPALPGAAPDQSGGQRLAAVLFSLQQAQQQPRPSVGLQTPALAAGPVMPQGAQSVVSGPRVESPGAALAQALTAIKGAGQAEGQPEPRSAVEAGGQAAAAGGAEAAVQFARSRVGQYKESGGANRGPQLDQLQARFGFKGAPWCFGAGTLVSTPSGLRAIETIQPGDTVYSASGVEREVLATGAREADTLELVAYGVDGTITTAEHPYLARRRLGKRTWADASWVDAGELQRGDLLVVPAPVARDAVEMAPERAYVVGRYLADGWQTRREAFICGALGERDEIATALNASGLRYSVRDYPTVVQFALCADSRALLAGCGAGAPEKRVPGHAMAWPAEARAALLRGYFDGDGSQSPTDGQQASSVSRQLIYGMAEIARSLGHVVKIRSYERSDVSVIGGRTVPCSPKSWLMSLAPEETSRTRLFLREDGQAWVPVRSVTPAGRGQVFNLTVAEDETFVADGVAVHNCAIFTSVAVTRGGAPKSARTASVAEVRRQAQEGGGGYQRGFRSSARPGDLLLFGNDHIAMVESVNRDGSYTTIEGNTGQGVVARRRRARGSGDIVRPRYAS